jgi:hypothetical protein
MRICSKRAMKKRKEESSVQCYVLGMAGVAAGAAVGAAGATAAAMGCAPVFVSVVAGTNGLGLRLCTNHPIGHSGFAQRNTSSSVSLLRGRNRRPEL